MNTLGRIKIIHILQSAGGVAEYLKMLVKNMDASKYESIFIVSNDYKAQELEIRQLAEQVFFVDMVREIDAIKDIKAVFQIVKIVKQTHPDVLYLHSSKAGALGRIATIFNKNIKILYNAHGWYFNANMSKLKRKIFIMIERILAYKANYIINISQEEYKSALQYKIGSANKLVVIENGIEIDKYREIEQYRENTRTKYKIGEQDIVVGIVGRLTEQKDPITSIKVAIEIINKYKNVYFMFVGSGELENQIREVAKNNHINDNIIITGWIKNVEEYIPAFDIAMLPSKWEGFGLAILEYMICKKPIIATNVGRNKRYFDRTKEWFFSD